MKLLLALAVLVLALLPSLGLWVVIIVSVAHRLLAAWR